MARLRHSPSVRPGLPTCRKLWPGISEAVSRTWGHSLLCSEINLKNFYFYCVLPEPKTMHSLKKQCERMMKLTFFLDYDSGVMFKINKSVFYKEQNQASLWSNMPSRQQAVSALEPNFRTPQVVQSVVLHTTLGSFVDRVCWKMYLSFRRGVRVLSKSILQKGHRKWNGKLFPPF